jgi:hypothetical protein
MAAEERESRAVQPLSVQFNTPVRAWLANSRGKFSVHGDLKLRPGWDDLRNDPRFDRILAESALPLATGG